MGIESFAAEVEEEMKSIDEDVRGAVMSGNRYGFNEAMGRMYKLGEYQHDFIRRYAGFVENVAKEINDPEIKQALIKKSKRINLIADLYARALEKWI